MADNKTMVNTPVGKSSNMEPKTTQNKLKVSNTNFEGDIPGFRWWRQRLPGQPAGELPQQQDQQHRQEDAYRIRRQPEAWQNLNAKARTRRT